MRQFNGELDLAIEIFRNRYPKKFLHQLVSSQLDMDRLDYLKRDSFFTGVTEGVIGSDRIIKMLNVLDDQLVVDEKGIYSIEKFLIARRLMYWQVYLHRTVVSSEQLLVMMLKKGPGAYFRRRCSFLLPRPWLISWNMLREVRSRQQKVFLEQFAPLDDNDILTSAKVWCNHSDRVLSMLSNGLVNRKLLSVELDNQPFPDRAG